MEIAERDPAFNETGSRSRPSAQGSMPSKPVLGSQGGTARPRPEGSGVVGRGTPPCCAPRQGLPFTHSSQVGASDLECLPD